ncbi:tellurite resistance protein permease [Glutamicibacter uratoxydans]|uniref:Tellurite resistance protein permease n=1 Tax=Glutamicibacter uratoxydans TaxID=43667 RepID=A0A4Y4DVZ7_GLUUR|nr:tellurite resistance/C4-dicarboxylate transporter family protein [Glutamicibacter uratoxydans]GED07600.1 tellurite resistance protein permease [Glutamicibacter uratoxydans]
MRRTQQGQDERRTATAAGNPGLLRELEHLSPGYFALVMGTGIISIGLHDVGQEAASRVLLAIAAASYVLLWVLYIWRAFAFRAAMLADLRAPDIAFAYFTVVAGTDVLAVRLGAAGWIQLSLPLVFFAACLWFVFGYLLPWQVLMTRDGRPILSRTNGTWFIWAVASQSLAIGMSVIQPHVSTGKYLIGLLAVMSWSVGVALYLGIAVLVLLRIVHFGITPREFEPPYWVAMGAMAIAVVAGSRIIQMESSPMVDATRVLIAATVAMFWSFCLWLIPMLIGAGIWRHLVHKVPLKYVPTLWSIVFPLGMFAVASINLGRVDRLPVVEAVGHGALVVSLIVWAIVFTAMLRHVLMAWWRGRRPTS